VDEAYKLRGVTTWYFNDGTIRRWMKHTI